MIRLEAFGQAVSELAKGAWHAAAPTLQVVFNRENIHAVFTRAVQAFTSLIGSPRNIYDHFQNPRIVAIISVPVVFLIVVKRVVTGATHSNTETVVVVEKDASISFKSVMEAIYPTLREDAQHLSYEEFVEKHGTDVLKVLDESTLSLLRHDAAPEVALVVQDAVQDGVESLTDRANAMALHLMSGNYNIHALRAIFNRDMLAAVTDPEGRAYISMLIENAVRNKTVTYPELRPLLNLQSIASMDPNCEHAQILRELFLSYEGCFTPGFQEDRRAFGIQDNSYVLLAEFISQTRVSKIGSRATLESRDQLV